MKKLGLYLKFGILPLSLFVVAIACWFLVSSDISGLRITILIIFLSFSIISGAESYKKIQKHRQIKRAFEYMKSVAIPYIINQSKNISATIEQYNDIIEINQAYDFCNLISNFDSIASEFDKSCWQFVYTPGLIGAFKKNEEGNKQFYNVQTAVTEVLKFTVILYAQAVESKNLLIGDPHKYPQKQQDKYLKHVQAIRDDLKEAIIFLNKYTKLLDDEVSYFLEENGTVTNLSPDEKLKSYNKSDIENLDNK